MVTDHSMTKGIGGSKAQPIRVGEHLENSAMASAHIGVSPKSYGVAVCLSTIFGVLGIHHFYLGRYLHGLLDVTMTIGGG